MPAHEKGVTITRREATPQERLASGDNRKGKLYVIGAKLAVHPGQALEHQAAKEQEAAKRKEREQKKKEEQEQIAAKRKQQEEQRRAKKRQKMQSAYEELLKEQESKGDLSGPEPVLSGGGGNSVETSPVPDRVGSSSGGNDSSSSKNDVARMPSSQEEGSDSPTDDDDEIPDPTPRELLAYSDEKYQERLKDIRSDIAAQRKAMEQELADKQKELEAKALEQSQAIKASILQQLQSDQKCVKCQRTVKFLVAECNICESKWCPDCLVKVNNENKCYLCQEAWVGKRKYGDESPVSESSIHVDGSKSLARFFCKQCPKDGAKKSTSWENGLEYARCCQNYVCRDHQNHHNCCVCGGGRVQCKSCEMGSCRRCGRELCDTCSYKEGCMCEDTSYRRDRYDYI